MKMGEAIKVPSSKCWHCGHSCDAATPIDDESQEPPAEGDFTVCISCGGFLVFTADQLLRAPLAKEILSLESEHRRKLMAVSVAIRSMRG